jgi:hypothetical protein
MNQFGDNLSPKRGDAQMLNYPRNPDLNPQLV